MEPRDYAKDDLHMDPMKPMQWMKPMDPLKPLAPWWPSALGDRPSSTGGQNDARYAFFGDQARLAVDLGDGKVAVYETGDLQIFGVQQQQDGIGRKILFVSQYGEVDLGTLMKSISL